jgi:hypothetical protein
MNGPSFYRIFLLRLWQEGDSTTSEPAPLRIVLEESPSGERCSFVSLEALLAHLASAVAPPENNHFTNQPVTMEDKS